MSIFAKLQEFEIRAMELEDRGMEVEDARRLALMQVCHPQRLRYAPGSIAGIVGTDTPAKPSNAARGF